MNISITQDDKKTIFIYGTLKRGQCRASVMEGQKFLGHAVTTPDYCMYSCGSYPALVKDRGGKQIQGELWRVDKDCIKRLDRIEGAPSLYKLEKITLEGDIQEAETYVYQRSVEGLIDCGVCWK